MPNIRCSSLLLIHNDCDLPRLCQRYPELVGRKGQPFTIAKILELERVGYARQDRARCGRLVYVATPDFLDRNGLFLGPGRTEEKIQVFRVSYADLQLIVDLVQGRQPPKIRPATHPPLKSDPKQRKVARRARRRQ